jgi:Glycosyl transferase family 4/Phospho-N-acetylmuramoyl-pentapeptide-transferase signature 1
VKTVLLSAAVSMFVALFGTPLAIKTFSRRGYGQEIRSDGPAGHLSKRGTPTMGGTVIIVASLTGYLIGHLVTGNAMSASGLLVLFLMTGLGLVGFLDDFIKLYMQRSLGLRSGAKLAGQAIVGVVFALLAIRFPDGYDLTPASTHLSFYADFGVSIGPVLFVVWVIVMVWGTSNGVNLTDGLDGLATGAAILVLAAYMIIGIWQLRNDCTVFLAQACYAVRDPQDLAIVERAARQDLHGRHRVPGPGRRDRRAGHHHPDRAAAVPARRAVRDHHPVGRDSGGIVQADRQAGVPDGPVAASLRAGRLGRDHDRRPLLDHRRHLRGPGPGHLLRRLTPIPLPWSAGR